MGASVVAETVLSTSAAREEDRVGDGLAFSDVYDRHAPFVWRTLRRLGVRERDVEDACQEVFLVVHRKLDALGEEPSIEGWIFQICRRVAAAQRRRASERRERANLAEVREPSVEPSQQDAIQHREARAILDAVLDGLDDRKREVFVLFELERVPMARVAELVGCPIKTAYARLYAARELVERGICRATRRRERTP